MSETSREDRAGCFVLPKGAMGPWYRVANGVLDPAEDDCVACDDPIGEDDELYFQLVFSSTSMVPSDSAMHEDCAEIVKEHTPHLDLIYDALDNAPGEE